VTTVTVVILNWNHPGDTLQCLASLDATEGLAFDVVVVDNDSVDDSVLVLRRHYPRLTIIENSENLGYAAGNNVGLRYAFAHGATHVLLLNDDAIMAPDTLPALVVAAETHPEAGLLGPKLLSQEEPGRLLAAGGHFDARWTPVHRGGGEMDSGQYDHIEAVPFLSGCALLVSRTFVETVGPLDPRFFVYYEDADWSYRAGKHGYAPTYVPSARVWHPETSERDADSQLVTYYMTRNRLLFLNKHRLGWMPLATTWLAYGLWLLNWTLHGDCRHRQRRDALWYGFTDALRGRVGRSERILT
jgi:GT2 family glycosyltransferase